MNNSFNLKAFIQKAIAEANHLFLIKSIYGDNILNIFKKGFL